jgi:hypothetical protein
MSDESKPRQKPHVQKIKVGRIVRYCLSARDATEINRRRAAEPRSSGWPAGAQAHVGVKAEPGEHFPMMVVRVSEADGRVNGQVFLNGTDVLWVVAIEQGADRGTWRWPPRAPSVA